MDLCRRWIIFNNGFSRAYQPKGLHLYYAFASNNYGNSNTIQLMDEQDLEIKTLGYRVYKNSE